MIDDRQGNLRGIMPVRAIGEAAGPSPVMLQSGLAKSPCSGLATRSLSPEPADVGAGFFCPEIDRGNPMACPPASEPRIRLLLGDITRIGADAIVNAANRSLLGGGGVDGAIHRAAGPELLVECRSLGGCQPGEARLTRGYRLPAAFVIHTVGPIWQGGNAGECLILEGCYRSSLAIARERRFSRIAFPAIATGVYGFPREAAAEIAVATTRAHLAAHETPQTVIFACFDEATFGTYRSALGAAG